MTPEGKVKAKVKQVLSKFGTWHYMPVQNGLGRTGIPDFIGCMPIVITPDMVGKRLGLFVAVETKAPGKVGSTTHNQDRELRGIHEAGGVAIVADDPFQVDVALCVYTSTGEKNGSS